MSQFYRNFAVTSLIGVGTFLFFSYADTLSQNPLFSRPDMVNIIRGLAKSVFVFCIAFMLVYWIVEARNKTKRQKISFLAALWAVFLGMGEAHIKREQAFYESMPRPLKRELPYGLFWLLFTIIAGAGAVVFMVWWGQNHL